MSTRTHRSLLVGLALAGLVASGLWFAGCGDAPAPRDPPPTVDLSRVEPQVAARIEGSRAKVQQQDASAERWADLAMVLHAHDYHAAALECYGRAAALAPGDYRWPYLAGLAAGRIDLRQATAHYEAAAALKPDSAAFYINYGHHLQELDRTAEAGAQYERALEIADESCHALFGLARIALLQDDLEGAAKLLDRARTTAPTEAEGHILRAQLLGRTGDRAGSKREAELARQAGTPTRAYDAVAAAMETLASSSKALARQGARLAEAGDFAGAEKLFRRVLTIRSGSASDHRNLAGALARQGKTPEAIKHYREALRLAPESVELLSNFGLVLAEAGDPRRGIELLEKALKLDATRHQAHHNLGLIYARQNDLQKALVHYREALRLNPAGAAVANDLGGVLARQGNLPEAVRIWTQALDGDPRALSVRYNLSLAQSTLGRHAEAIALLEEGCRQAPRSTRFQALLAWELATAPDPDVRDGDKALGIARRLHAAAPAKPETADLLGAALAATARFREAASTVEKALAARPPPPAPVARGLRERLALYKQYRPYRQPR